MSRSAPPAPVRAALVADCQHMATSAMGIAADLARIGEQECAGTPCSAEALAYIRQRIEALAGIAGTRF
jgi:hypothetical protein